MTGARFDPLLPFETWRRLGERIAGYSNATCWWLGDWLAFGQMKYGRRYKEAIAATGLEYQTLRNYAVVARRFEISRRRNDLSFQHHAELCAISDDEQDRWLERASAHGWTRSELRSRIRASRAAEPAAHVMRLAVAPEHFESWRKAARRSNRDLHDWIVGVLDEAAARALEERRA